jgi:hypothetical protein
MDISNHCVNHTDLEHDELFLLTAKLRSSGRTLFVALIIPFRRKPFRGNLHVKLMFVKRPFGVTLPQAHLAILNHYDNGQEGL